jgi:DNA-binding transcriptional MerR regulator
MNIGQLARETGVTPDTLRYYEREGLLVPPARGDNGYRRYGAADAGRVRFVRSAQALGFSLSEIRRILPRLDAGQVGRREIEGHLQAKIAEIDAHMRQLQALKRELVATFEGLRCQLDGAVAIAQATVQKPVAAPAPRRRLRSGPAAQR